jgi:hypothetical protein
MTSAAAEVWRAVYPTISEGHGGLLGAVTGRAEAQCLRLALVYALMDECGEVDRSHLEAAIALWEYCEASARFIFGSSLGDRVADNILRSMRVAGPSGLTRTEIRDLFNKHESSERIEVALALLQSRGLAMMGKRGGDGRHAEVWRVATATEAIYATEAPVSHPSVASVASVAGGH